MAAANPASGTALNTTVGISCCYSNRLGADGYGLQQQFTRLTRRLFPRHGQPDHNPDHVNGGTFFKFNACSNNHRCANNDRTGDHNINHHYDNFDDYYDSTPAAHHLFAST